MPNANADRLSEYAQITLQILNMLEMTSVDQMDRMPKELRDNDIRRFAPASHKDIDRMVSRIGAEIGERKNANDAYYLVSADRIVVPHRDKHETHDTFYAVLFHELTHWTGNEKRLNRLSKDDDKNAYGFEELVSELAALGICARLGIQGNFLGSTTYIRNWAGEIDADQATIFRAAVKAREAAEYLLDRMQPPEAA